MLVDLEALDVVRGHGQSDQDHDAKKTDAGLRRDCTAKGSSSDDEGSYHAEDQQYRHDVSVDSMEQYVTIPDSRDELPDHQDAGRKDGAKVHNYADLIDAMAVPVESQICQEPLRSIMSVPA